MAPTDIQVAKFLSKEVECHEKIVLLYDNKTKTIITRKICTYPRTKHNG